MKTTTILMGGKIAVLAGATHVAGQVEEAMHPFSTRSNASHDKIPRDQRNRSAAELP
jgi:hypothetical protein